MQKFLFPGSRHRANGAFSRLAATLALALPLTGHAFQFESGTLRGSLDTTLSYGAMWRVQDRDERLVCTANGGSAWGCNADDGNLNYGTGLVSNTAKITSELDISTGNGFGAFIRASGFYDFENENGDRERTPLTSQAKDLVGSDAELLDAYVWSRFDIGSMPTEVRIGQQVVNWGESTFIQNGINATNPVDVSKLRVPGAELREALVPVNLVYGSISASENTTFEAYYQLDWQETVIDPPGSYFSTNDFVGEGGSHVMLGFGDATDAGGVGGGIATTPLSVPRDPTLEAKDEDQFGLALRLFVPQLNDTEFGVYYVRYHSRVPVINARTGTLSGLQTAGAIGGAAVPIATATQTYLFFNPGDIPGAVAAGTTAGVTAGAPSEASQAIAFTAATSPSDVPTVATALATDAYAKTAAYATEYPEGIDLFGLSLNTTVGGVAVQGEVSHRRDVPLQVDDLEVLYAALGPTQTTALGVANLNQLYTSGLIPNVATDCAPLGVCLEYPIPGYIKRDVTQIQTTFTQIISNVLGADQAVFVGEAAISHVHDMPKKSELRLNGPGTFVSGNAALGPGTHPGKPIETADHFADATSWGYRLAARLDFNNAIGAVSLKPRFAWAHDVSGISPGPGGNFLEGRKAITIGVTADYQNRLSADIAYTRFSGAGRYNLSNDRDFISANIKYSF
jgi:hypothetical protein